MFAVGLGPVLSIFPKRCSSAAALQSLISKELDGIKAAGTWKTERVITSPQAADVSVEGIKGDVINFCANNYLGLAVSCRFVLPFLDRVTLEWSKLLLNVSKLMVRE